MRLFGNCFADSSRLPSPPQPLQIFRSMYSPETNPCLYIHIIGTEGSVAAFTDPVVTASVRTDGSKESWIEIAIDIAYIQFWRPHFSRSWCPSPPAESSCLQFHAAESERVRIQKATVTISPPVNVVLESKHSPPLGRCGDRATMTCE